MKQHSSQSAGVLVRQGQGEASYRAFVPHLLPPKLDYEAALVRALSEADRALGELAGLGRTMPNPQLLIRPFIRREAVLSSRIEGTQADVSDVYAYEAGQTSSSGARTAPSEADVREVLNYIHALEYGLERIHSLSLSLRLLRELHERLMAGVRGDAATPGEFRRSQNWIGPPGCTLNPARFVPPPVPEMHGALDAFEKYLHQEDEYPPLVRLAFIHYQFEAIHPFLDGNGRIGRLLLSLLLVHWDMLPEPLLYLSAYFERRRQEYYDHLLVVSEGSAWHGWVLFFLRGVAQQARDAVVRAKRLQDLQQEWRQHLIQTQARSALLLLADQLFITPFLTVPQAQQILGMTYPSAKANIDRLVEAGILQRWVDNTYSKMFAAEKILHAVERNSQQLIV